MLDGLTVSGMTSRSPGQPSQRWIEQKSKAEGLVEEYRTRPVVRAFYQAVAETAQRMLDSELARDEERFG